MDGFVSVKTLENIEESRAPRPTRSLDKYRSLSRKTRILLRRDKESYVWDLAEEVKGNLDANNLRPAN